jgi:hypothetical protein
MEAVRRTTPARIFSRVALARQRGPRASLMHPWARAACWARDFWQRLRRLVGMFSFFFLFLFIFFLLFIFSFRASFLFIFIFCFMWFFYYSFHFYVSFISFFLSFSLLSCSY